MTRTKKPRRETSVQLRGAFDIECENWDQFVLGCLFEPKYGPRIHGTEGALVDDLLKRGGHWWAWNGGRYDFLLVAEILRRRGVPYQPHLAGNRVTRITCGELTLHDACALIPMNGDLAADLCGHPRAVLGWDCVCRPDDAAEPCGGYCRIKRTLRGKAWERLASYCAEDTAIAYKAVAHVLTLGARHGLVMRGTIGGTAWATAQAWLGLPDASGTHAPHPWEARHWHTTREAYFGGRMIVARPTMAYGDHWDLNAAYPGALAATALPQGPCEDAGLARARKGFERGVPGVYRATVHVPIDTYVPPLPVRAPNEAVWYPVGPVTGWWTQPELRRAVERGCTIQRLDEALVWPREPAVPVFGPAIDRWYAARLAAGKPSAEGRWWRELAVSVTGKLAQRPEAYRYEVHPTARGRTPKICDPGKPRCARAGCTERRCTERCKSWKQLDKWGEAWAIPYYAIGKSAHIHWAAYLTAETRGAWLAGAEAVGAGLGYGNTDSIWSASGEPVPVGPGLGAWAHKERFAGFEAKALGTYAYIDADGVPIYRVAGAPTLSAADWTAGRKVVDRGVLSFSEAVVGDLDRLDTAAGRVRGDATFEVEALEGPAADRPSLFRRKHWVGRLPVPDGLYGDRELNASDGRTYPLTYVQILQAQARRRGG